MKAYLAIKFKEDFSNKGLVESISSILERSRVKTVVMARDYEKWGQIKLSPEELMRETFKEIYNSDLLVIEFSEKGVGLGIEAGYAFACKKPIFVIAKEGSDISSTLRGISTNVIFYDNPEDIFHKIKL